MRELPSVISAAERNGTLYLRLSDGTNAVRHADGKSMCHNRRCIAKRVAWDCPHAVAAALYLPKAAFRLLRKAESNRPNHHQPLRTER